VPKSTQIILTDEEEVIEAFKNPNSPEQQEEALKVIEQVREMYDNQEREWLEFNDRTLKDYEDDNQKRINNYVEPRNEEIDDWQTRGFEGITREKMFAFVSKVAMDRPRHKFKATNKKGFIDKIVAESVSHIYDYTWQKEDPTGLQFFFDAWASAGSGTVIRWEGVEQTTQMVEEFESYDVTTGEIKGLTSVEKKSDINCKARRVDLTKFLISDWYQPDIQLQSAVAEVQDLSRYDFERQYGHYMHAKKVPHLDMLKEFNDGSFYVNQWDTIQTDRVQVVHYYQKSPIGSKYRIVANGVLILATPIPRKDGNYPFTKGIFKPFANTNFFYGKALPDEIASDQDVYNAFKNMVLDRAILYVQRPLIGENITEIEDELFKPNGIINIKGGKLSTMDYSPPGQADIQILEYLRAATNRQTSDAQQSGQTGKGVTAREIVIADENARKLAGVFRLFLEDFELHGTKLRVGSIFQFYFEPVKLNEILDADEAGELEMAYRTFALDGQTLSDKKNGIKVLNVVGKSEDIPMQEDIDADEMAAKKQGFELENMYVTADYIKNFDIDVVIIPESSFEQSRSLELAMEDEYIATIGKFFPTKMQQFEDVLFKEFNEVHDKDMSEFDKAKPVPLPMPEGAQAGMPGPGGNGTGAELMAADQGLSQLTG